MDTPFRIIERLCNNLEINQAKNVTVVRKVAWKETGRKLPFYCDPSLYSAASSLTHREGFTDEIHVNTVTLDDYCEEHDLIPHGLKLDVEGAEFEALVGAKKLLARWKPVLVLEYFPKPTPRNDALEFLDELGYIFYDVNLYRRVTRQFYRTYGSGPYLVNVLAIAGGSIRCSPYNHVALRDQQDVVVEEGRLKTDPIPLAFAARHVVAFDFDGPKPDVAEIAVLASDGERLGYQPGPVFHLKTHSCSHMIFETDQPCEISCELQVKQGDPGQLKFHRVQVARIVLGSES